VYFFGTLKLGEKAALKTKKERKLRLHYCSCLWCQMLIVNNAVVLAIKLTAIQSQRLFHCSVAVIVFCCRPHRLCAWISSNFSQ
jgi:hypothetical protein